jgi:hypothetical protein
MGNLKDKIKKNKDLINSALVGLGSYGAYKLSKEKLTYKSAKNFIDNYDKLSSAKHSDENKKLVNELLKRRGSSNGVNFINKEAFDIRVAPEGSVPDLLNPKVGPHYNPKTKMVNINKDAIASTLSHELIHKDYTEKKLKGLGSLFHDNRISIPIKLTNKLLGSANSIHSGYRVGKDKILGQKTNKFIKYKGVLLPILTQSVTLGQEAYANLEGQKAIKNLGASKEYMKDSNNLAKYAFSTYLVEALINISLSIMTQKLTELIVLGKFRSMSESDKRNHLYKELKKDSRTKNLPEDLINELIEKQLNKYK